MPGAAPEGHRLAPACGPAMTTTGPDGALWFTEWGGDRVGTVTAEGVIEARSRRSVSRGGEVRGPELIGQGPGATSGSPEAPGGLRMDVSQVRKPVSTFRTKCGRSG
ncbi:hypothetical protein SHKM778_25210 [Streptomyces sp. KM77-8]|uniref:Virginiamycin B lyase n=1 Tax=Streptomyces haneummycinicus TaxID=3074435 RepID=A0AAT9HFS9_9ACTN